MGMEVHDAFIKLESLHCIDDPIKWYIEGVSKIMVQAGRGWFKSKSETSVFDNFWY